MTVKFYRYPIPVRVNHWLNRPNWTIREFAFIYSGYQPTACENLDNIDDYELLYAISDWKAWAPGCPWLDPNKSDTFETPIPKEKLVTWAQSLKNVVLPDWMLPLLAEFSPEKTNEIPTDLGNKERQTLLRIIGGLAAALVEAKDKSKNGLKSDTGTIDNPNISGVTRLCQKHTGKKKGMSKSNIDGLISAGLQAIKE